MLERLLIRNFQKHRKLEIEFSPTVTTIVGPNRAGKSSILRALWWLVSNKPSGKAFQRHGSKRTTVECVVDGVHILRRRGKENSYSRQGSKFRAFANSVPESIARTFNLSGLAYQRQLESHFWFHLTPGQLAKELNSIVDFGLIDSSQTFISRKVRSEESLLRATQERLEEARAVKKELEWTVGVDQELKELEQMESELSRLRLKRASLKRILRDVDRLKEEETVLLQAVPFGERLVTLGNKLLSISNRRKSLSSTLEQIKTKRRELVEIEGQRVEVELQLSKVKECPVCQSPLQ